MQTGALDLKLMADISDVVAKMRSLEGMVGGTFNSIRGFATSMAGSIAAAFSVTAIAAWIKGAINAADEASKLAQKIGVATSDVAGLTLAYQLSGAGADAMAGSVSRLAKGIADNNIALQAMGVKTKDAQGNLRGTKDILYEVADKIAAMPDGIGKTAVAVELFGKAGAEMIPLLNSGSQGFKDMADMAEKLGLVVDTETGKKAEEFNDTLDLIHKSSQGLATKVTAQLLPTLQSLAGDFLSAATKGDNLQLVSMAISGTLKGVYIAASGAINIFSALGGVWARIFAAAEAAIDGRFGDAMGELKAIPSDLKADWTDWSERMKKVWNDQAGASVASATKTTKSQKDLLEILRKQQEAAKAAADEAKKAAALIAELSGLSGSFADDWNRLNAMYAKGLLTQQQLLEAQAQLLAKQPAIKKSEEEQLALIKQRVDLRAKDYADSIAESNKITEAWRQQLQAIDAAVKAQEDEAAARQLIVQLNVSHAEAIQMVTIARLHDEQARLAADSAGYKALQDQIDAAEKLRGLLHDQEAWDKQQEMINSIEQSAHDVWTNVLEGGTNVWKKLKDTAKTIFFDWLYQMTLKKWIINIAAAITGAGAGFAQAATGSAGSSILGSGVGSLLSSTVGAGGFMGYAGTGLMNTLMGTGLSTGFGAGLSMLQGGSVMQGAGMMAGSALPYVGVALAIASALGAFDHGGPKTESGYGFGVPNRGDPSGATQIGQGIQSQYAALASLYGLSPELSNFGVFYAQDPQGTAQTQLNITGGSYNRASLYGGNYENVGRGQGDLEGAIALASAHLIVKNLQEQVSGPVGDYLKSIDITTASLETLNQALQVATDVGTFDKAISALGPTFADLANLSVETKEALVQAAGGVQGFTSEISGFFNDFFTEAEKHDALLAQLTTTYADANVTLPTTRDAFRAAVLAAMAAGDTSTVQLLLSTEAAFNQLYPAIEATGQAADSFLQDYIPKLMAAGKQVSSEGQKWAAFKAQVAGQTLGNAVAKAQQDYQNAMNAQAGALDSTVVKLRSFAQSLKDLRDQINLGEQGGLTESQRYAAAKAALAGANADNVKDLVKQFLDLVPGQATSRLGQLRDVDFANAMLSKFENNANAQATSIAGSIDAANAAAQLIAYVKANIAQLNQSTYGQSQAQAGSAYDSFIYGDAFTHSGMSKDAFAQWARENFGWVVDPSMLPSYDVGSWNVPQTGPAMLHGGEVVMNRAMSDGMVGMLAGVNERLERLDAKLAAIAGHTNRGANAGEKAEKHLLGAVNGETPISTTAAP